MAASQLSYLLTNQLASDDALSAPGSLHASLALSIVQTGQLIRQTEAEARSPTSEAEKATSVLHRWILRLTSLINSKNGLFVQLTGFQLAFETCQQSDSIFRQHSKAWHGAALALIARKNTSIPVQLLGCACNLLLHCFERAHYLPEYAREVANPASARKFGDALLALADSASNEEAVRAQAMTSLARLLHQSATPLRPIAQQMQACAISQLCDGGVRASPAAGELLANVYLTAGKAQAGHSWRRTVEALVGSIHPLLETLTSTYIQERNASSSLAPLDLPSLPKQKSSREVYIPLKTVSDRMNSLFAVLLQMLCSVTERAVPVPIGMLVSLAERLLGVTAHSPTVDRSDASLKDAQSTMLPEIHVQACRLLASLSRSLGTHLADYSTHILSHLSYVSATYTASSPMRATLASTAALLVSHCPVHPDEAIRPLGKLVRSILDDTAVLLDIETKRQPAPTASLKGAEGQRKTKKARLFESDEATASKARLTAEDVVCVEHSLKALNAILSSAPHLLEPQLLNLTLRVLLATAMAPSFFSTMASSFPYAASTLSEALDLVPSLRATVLNCLCSALKTRARDAPGFLDYAIGVFRTAARSGDEAEESIADVALSILQTVARPALPPLLRTRAMQMSLEGLAGGSVIRPSVISSLQPEGAEDSVSPIRSTVTRAVSPAQGRHFTSSSSNTAAALPASVTTPVQGNVAQPNGSTIPSIGPQSSSEGAQVPAQHASSMTAETIFSVPPALQSMRAEPSQTTRSEQKPLDDVDMSTPVNSEGVTMGAETSGAVRRNEGQLSAGVGDKRMRSLDDNEESDSDEDGPMPKIVLSSDEGEGDD